MINKTSIKIAYPIRVGFLSINTKRTVKFSFDNFSLFLFQQRHKIETAEQLAEWRKNNGEYDAMIWALYSAAESEAVQNRKRFKLDAKKFALGFAAAKKEDIEKVIEVWKRSQSFGSATIPGKKKVTTKH